jgi:hypothetical protein
MATPLVSPDPAMLPELLDVKQVAALCHCSERHIFRMCDRSAIEWCWRGFGFHRGTKHWDRILLCFPLPAVYAVCSPYLPQKDRG